MPLPVGIEIPTTIKGSVIRAQLYTAFERELGNGYASVEEQFKGTMELSMSDLEKCLMKLAQQVIRPQLSDLHDDRV